MKLREIDLCQSYENLWSQQQEFYDNITWFFDSRDKIIPVKLSNLLSNSLISVLEKPYQRSIFEAIEAQYDISQLNIENQARREDIKVQWYALGILTRESVKELKYTNKYPQEKLTTDVLRAHLRIVEIIEDFRGEIIEDFRGESINNSEIVELPYRKKVYNEQQIKLALDKLWCEYIDQKWSHETRMSPFSGEQFTVVVPHWGGKNRKEQKKWTFSSMLRKAKILYPDFMIAVQ